MLGCHLQALGGGLWGPRWCGTTVAVLSREAPSLESCLSPQLAPGPEPGFSSRGPGSAGEIYLPDVVLSLQAGGQYEVIGKINPSGTRAPATMLIASHAMAIGWRGSLDSVLSMGLQLMIPNPWLACRHFWNTPGSRVPTFQSPFPPKVRPTAPREKGVFVHLWGRVRNSVDGTKGSQEILGWKRRCGAFCPLVSGLEATISKHRVTMVPSCGPYSCPGYLCIPWAPLPPQKGPASGGLYIDWVVRPGVWGCM